MSEEIKDVNKKIDQAEATVKKYASKDTVISIGGYEFTPAKLMVAFTLVSSILGGLYGTFEVYKDYQSMKKKIENYESPDLSGFQEQLSVIKKEMEKVTQSVNDARDYTRDIKNTLREDISRIERVADSAERRVKESDDKIRQLVDNASQRFDNKRDQLSIDNDRKLKDLEDRMSRRIQSALDNPLSK